MNFIWPYTCNKKVLWLFICYLTICMDLREIGWGGMDWIRLAQERDLWRALLNTAMNLWVPWNVGNFLSSWAIGAFSRRTQLRGVRWLVMSFSHRVCFRVRTQLAALCSKLCRLGDETPSNVKRREWDKRIKKIKERRRGRWLNAWKKWFRGISLFCPVTVCGFDVP
jgi:hypothetical protein